MTPIIKLVNATTGEEIEREMTADELTVYEKDLESAAKEAEELAKKEAAKTAAEAKLAALGLTTDDLKALGLGTN
jgi:hypothetical protein